MILDRLGATTWSGESDEFPHVVFNTIKDNASYANILQTLPADKGRWAIQWMEAYVKSLAGFPGLPSLLPLMIQYLCEELQHERFKNVRASAVCVAAKVRRGLVCSGW